MVIHTCGGTTTIPNFLSYAVSTTGSVSGGGTTGSASTTGVPTCGCLNCSCDGAECPFFIELDYCVALDFACGTYCIGYYSSASIDDSGYLAFAVDQTNYELFLEDEPFSYNEDLSFPYAVSCLDSGEGIVESSNMYLLFCCDDAGLSGGCEIVFQTYFEAVTNSTSPSGSASSSTAASSSTTGTASVSGGATASGSIVLLLFVAFAAL